MSDPILNNDLIGIPGVGTQTVYSNTYGSNWQFGIAIDLNNRKFEFSKVIKFSLAADDFGISEPAINTHQIGISHSAQDISSLPSNYLQYGDKALIGPSTKVGYEGYTETIRISTAAQVTATNTNSWSNGILYSLDRKNKYRYQLGDSVTLKGTGQAAGWEAQNAQMATLGIVSGYSALGEMGRYISYNSTAMRDQAIEWENSLGSNFAGIKIMLPTHSAYSTDTNSNQPAIHNSTRGLAPWRANWTTLNTGTLDWFTASGQQGVFRYIRKHNDDSDYALLAYNTNSTIDGTNLSLENTHAPLLTGFVHPGGEYKQHAQCLFTMVNSLSTTSGADKISNGIFTQYLTRSINDSQDMSYAKLIPNTHYRLGITWKGDIQGSVSSNSKTFAKFQWGPTTYHGSADTNHYQGAMLSTSELLNSGSPTQSTYTTNMVSGYVGAVNTDLLDPDNNNLKIEVIQQAATASTTVAAQNNRGGEIKTFIDSIWLEHEGDLANASGNGYVEIDHAPAQGTLSINRFEAVKPKTVILADGTSEKIDTTGFNKRWLYKIKADFNYTNADIWETFRSLMKWQDKGYKLALHPFLPEIPHCLVGFLEIQNIRKSFWDLNKFTFSVQFTETD